jgi:hypothetical protein
MLATEAPIEAEAAIDQTQAPPCLPDPGFMARVAVRWDSPLHSCRHLWDGYALECSVLDATPLKDVHWATLQAYMQRRFGPGHMGADDYKDLGAGWMLSTPDPDVFVDVCPSLSGAGFSFTPRCADQVGSRPSMDDVHPERIDQIKRAYRATLIDLLRPVCVRDQQFNALGEVDDDDELMHYDEATEACIYGAERHSSAGYAMPAGLFGGEDWATLCALISQCGGGDMETGRAAVIALLRKPVLDEISHSPWPVKVLTLLGCPRDAGMHEQVGLTPQELESFLAERESWQRAGDPSVEITDAALQTSVAFLDRLGFNGASLRRSVESRREQQQINEAWGDLVSTVPDRQFPDDAIPAAPWPVGDDPVGIFRAGLVEHGHMAIAAWVDRTLARPRGVQTLQQILWHLARENSQADSTRTGGQ